MLLAAIFSDNWHTVRDVFTLKDGADFLEDSQAAGAEVLTEAELEQQKRHSDEEYHHYVGNEKRTCTSRDP